MTRSVPVGSSRCPESLDVVPLCQMVAVPVHKTVLMVRFLFEMMMLIVLLSHVTAYWLCLSPFIVSLMYSLFYSLIRLCFIMEDTVYSLC